MGLGFVVIIVAVLGAWFVALYNRLIALKNQVANAWKQIDVQLKRRHDLVPNLVEAVKGAMQFEQQTLQAVIEARNIAVKAAAGATPATAGPAIAAEQQLTGALGRLMAVVEAYPDLKATGNIAQLQEELTSTENKVGFARQLYNDTATQYNTVQQQFPSNLVAGFAGAAPAALWEISDDRERAVPQVKLT